LIDVRCVIASQILARLIAEKFDIPMGGDAPVRIGIVKGVYTKKGYGHVWNALYAGSSEPALFIDGSYGQFQNFYEGAILAEDYGAALHGLDLKEISRTPLLRLNDKQLKRAEEAYSALRKALAKEGLLTSPGRSQFADDIWEQALAAVHRKPAADFTRTEHANLRYALARGVAKQTGEQCPGVAKIWLVGSVAAGGVDTVGPESDIDLVVEVTSEAARREAVRTLRLIDRALVMKFNGYFSSHTVPLDKLLDITGKVFLKEEIAARKGFAGLVQSLYEPPTLLFQRAAGPVAAEAARSEARDEDAAEAREDTALRESVRAEPLQPLAVAPQQGVQGPPAETIIKKITWYDEALEFLGQQANGQKRPFANVVIFNTKTDVKFHFSQLFPAWLARIWAKEKTWGEKALLNGWANRLVHVSPSGGSLRIWEMKKVWWWFFPVIAEIKEKNREKVLRKMTGSETLVIADSRAFSLPEASSRGVAFRDPLSFPAYFKKQAAPLLQFLQQHRLNMDPSVYWVTESAEASKNEALRDDLAEQLRQSLDTIQSVEKKPADSLSGLFREISGTEEDRNFLQDCLKEVKERGLFTLSQFEYIKRKVRYKFVAGEPYLCRVFFDEQEGIPVFHVNRDWIRLHEKKKIMGRLAAKGFQEAEVRELVRLKYVYLLARSLTQAAVARFMEQMHLLEGEAGIYHEREKRAVALLADTEFLHASRGDAQKILRFSKLVKMLDPETDMALFVEDRQLRKDFLNNHRSYQELLQEILDGRFYALTFSGEPRWLKSIHRFLDHEKHAYKVHKTENTENLKASQSASRKDLKSFRRILRYKRLFRNYMTYWLPQEMNVEQISKLGYANEWTLELNGNSIPVLLNHTFPYDYNAKRLSENLSKDVGGVTFLEATIANIHRKKILPEQVQKIYIRPLDKQSNFKFCFYVMVVTSEGVFDFALLLAQPVPRWEGGVGFKDFLVDGEAELKTIQKASERDPEIGLTLGAYYQGDQITTGDFFSIRYAGRDLKRILTQPHDQLKDHARADFLQNIFARYLRSYYRMGGYQCVIDIKPSNVASLDLIVRIVDYGINAYDGKIAVMSAVINGLLDETSDFGKMWHFPPYTDDRKYIFSGILEAFTNDKKPNDPEFHYRLALGLEFLRQIREDPYDVLTEKAKKAINDFFADNRSWRDFKRLDHLSSAQTKIEEGPWPVVDKDYQNLGPVPDIRFEKIDEELYQTNDPKKVSYAFLARLAGVSVPSDLKTLPHDQVIRLLDHILLDHLVLPDEIYLGILKALAQRYQVQNESIPDRKTYRAFLRVLKEQAAMALDNKSLPTRKVKVTVLDADLVRKLSITQIELLLRKFIEVPDSYTPLLGNAENDFAKEAVLIADLTEMAELKNASLRKLLQQARLKYDRLTSGKGQVEEKGSPPVDSAQPGQARSEMRQAKVVTTRSPWKYFWMLQRAGWAEKGPAIAGGAALWMLGSSQEGLIGLFAKVLAGAVLAKPFYLTVFYFIHEMGHFFYEKAVGGEPEFRFYPATLNTQVSPDKFNHLTLSHHRKIWGSGFALSFPFLIMMNAIVWLGARETFLITLAGMCAALEGRYFWRFDGRSLLVSLLDPEAAVESIIIAGLEKNRVHQKPVAFGTSQPPFNDPRRAEMRSPDQAVKMLMVAARIAQEQDDRDFGPGRLVKGMVAAFRNERPYQDAEARLLAAAKKFLAEDAPAVPENDKGWEALLDHPQAYECFLIAKKNEGAAKRSEVRESLTGDAEALPATPHHLSTVALFHKLGDSGEELSREDAYWLNRRVNGPAYSKEVVEVNFGAVITKLRELLGELRGKSIVEIGCGDGMLLRYLSEELGMEVRGIEKSPFALNLARTENGLAGKVWGPEEQGNIRDGFADVVLSVRVLEPLIMLEYQATSVIRSLDAMLKRGGLQMHVTSDTPHIEALVKAGYSKVDHSGLPPFNHCVWARKPFHRTGHSRSELRAPEMPRDPMVEEVNRITSTPGLSKVTLSLLKVARWLSPDFNGLFVLVGVGRDIQENLKVIAEALPNAHVLGIDYDAGVVKAAQKALAGFPEAVRSRIRVEQGNAKNLRELLEDETAGVVYFESVFGLYGQNDDRHQALLHAMIRESHRILRPGGLLVISDAYAGLRSDRIVDDLGFESLSREGGLYSLIVKKPALSQSAGPAGPRAEVHVATDGTFAARQKSSDAVRMAEETAQARSEMRASGVAGTLARLAIPADAVVAQRPGIGRIIDLGRLSLSFEETGSLAGELAALEKEAFDGREAFGQRDDWMRALEKPSAVLILLNEKNELTGFSFVRPASAFFENKLQRIVSKKDNVKGKGTFLMDAVLSRLYHKKETHLVWGSYWRVSDDFYQDYIARGEALGFLEDAGSLGRDFSINIIADPLAPVRRPRKMVRGRSENENSADKIDGRVLAASKTHRAEVRDAIENMKGKFTIVTDLADVAQFTDKQLEEFEVMAVLQPNVKFVFHGDRDEVISRDARKRLEKLQAELGADRIVITEGGIGDLAMNKGEKVIQISKSGTEYRVRSAEAKLSRRNPYALRRTAKIFSFRYLGEETGLVPMALLYADQHEQPSPKGMMDLSMAGAALRVAIQEFHNSIVFARAA